MVARSPPLPFETFASSDSAFDLGSPAVEGAVTGEGVVSSHDGCHSNRSRLLHGQLSTTCGLCSCECNAYVN